MKSTTNSSPEARRIQSRLRGEYRARMALIRLVCITSILRTALTHLMPLAGGSLWWVTLLCLLPGLAVTGLLTLAMRLTGSRTLTEMTRACLGRAGVWAVCGILALLLVQDGLSAMTGLITVFTEGIGTRGTQLTLALLTGAVLLLCLSPEGLPRGVYLLRHVLLGAAMLAAIYSVNGMKPDRLFPLWGAGRAAIAEALRAGVSIAWPLTFLLTLPEAEGKPRLVSACPVTVIVLGALLSVSLLIPHEVLSGISSLADCLLTPVRFASPAGRMLVQCLMMTALFLAIGGAALLASELLTMPAAKELRWLPAGVLTLLTLSQALDTARLWTILRLAEEWLLLPLAGLALLCVSIAIIRRKDA